MQKYYGVDIKKQRESLLKSEAAKPLIDEVIKKADRAIGKSYEALKISEYMLFFKTGDRATFEKKHMERRYDALDLAAALWLTEDDKYLESLENVLFHILDEFTWCVASHTKFYQGKKTPEWYREEVELFNARTAVLLCDIYTIVGDKLTVLTKERIAEELRRRIIEPTKKKVFHWEAWDNNWLSYCVIGMSLSTALFGTKEEMDSLIPRFQGLCERYLGGFGEDCCCLEGGSYWGAFTEFLRCAVVINDWTDGKVNLLEDKRVEEIGKFQTKVLMSPDNMAAFSDSVAKLSFRPGVICFLNKLFPGKIFMPDLKYMAPIGSMGLGLIELLWFDAEYKTEPLMPLTSYFPIGEWFISRKKNYSFASKGGYNEEPHNHNDIGSFMAVSKDGKTPFVEIGTGLYTRQYFEDDKRYKILNNGSHGHSVTVINDEYQEFGKEFKAKNTLAGDDYFETDISGAYKDGLIKKITRRFDLKENGFTLKDNFVFSDKTESFKERFIVSDNPKINGGEIALDGATCVFDNDKYSVSVLIEKCTYSTGEERIVTILDFLPTGEEREFMMEVKF